MTPGAGAGAAADVLRVMPSKAIELAAFDGFKRLFGSVPLTLPHAGGPNVQLALGPREDRSVGPYATMLAGALAGAAPTPRHRRRPHTSRRFPPLSKGGGQGSLSRCEALAKS